MYCLNDGGKSHCLSLSFIPNHVIFKSRIIWNPQNITYLLWPMKNEVHKKYIWSLIFYNVLKRIKASRCIKKHVFISKQKQLEFTTVTTKWVQNTLCWHVQVLSLLSTVFKMEIWFLFTCHVIVLGSALCSHGPVIKFHMFDSGVL